MSKWDWQVFLQDTGGGRTYLEWLMSAWGWTLSVAVLSLIVALLVGSLIGILRTTPNKWFVGFGNAWTELFRNIPLLVQIFLWYHVIPSIFLSLRALPSRWPIRSSKNQRASVPGCSDRVGGPPWAESRSPRVSQPRPSSGCGTSRPHRRLR